MFTDMNRADNQKTKAVIAIKFSSTFQTLWLLRLCRPLRLRRSLPRSLAARLARHNWCIIYKLARRLPPFKNQPR